MAKFDVFLVCKNHLYSLFGLLWHIWIALIALICTLIFGPIIYLFSFKTNHFKFSYFFIFLWAVCIFHLSGFYYTLENLNRLKIQDNQQYIFISNHTSVMDICLMVLLHPKHLICFVGKKELEKIPVFGSIYKRIAVMVDRASEQSRMSVFKRCAAKMREGKSLVIFPEGGVTEDASVDLLDFKDGAFSLATEHQFPIVVYTFVGLKEKFPFSYTKGRPGKIKVVLNAILEPNASKQDLKQISYNLMKTSLGTKK